MGTESLQERQGTKRRVYNYNIQSYRRYQALLIGNVQIHTYFQPCSTCTQVPQTSNLAHVAQTNVLHLKEMKKFTL